MQLSVFVPECVDIPNVHASCATTLLLLYRERDHFAFEIMLPLFD